VQKHAHYTLCLHTCTFGNRRTARAHPCPTLPYAAGARATPEPAPHVRTQIFTRTCDSTRRIALMLRNLGFGAVPIHGQMGQPKRLGALNKFKAGKWGLPWAR